MLPHFAGFNSFFITMRKNFILNMIISLVLSYNILSTVVPFSTYPKITKLIVVILVFSLSYLLSRYILDNYLFLFYSLSLRKKIQIIVIASVFSFAVSFFSHFQRPLYPIEYSINLQANTENVNVFIQQEIEEIQQKLIEPKSINNIEDWDYQTGRINSPKNELIELNYYIFQYINGNVNYKFTFYPQNNVSEAVIKFDNTNYSVNIPDNRKENEPFIYTIIPPQKASVSSFWNIWQLIFPMMRWILFFIHFFIGGTIIFSTALDEKRRFFKYFLFLILSYLFFNALHFQNELFNLHENKIIWLWTSILFFIVVPIAIQFFIKKKPSIQSLLLVLIFLLAAGLRIYWINMVPTEQVSDFGSFHYKALQIANDENGVYIEKHSNFVRLLSIIYKISPTHEIFEKINILFSLLTIFCIYKIGQFTLSKSTGIIAAYLYAIFPSQISMVSIVNTDILSTSLLILSITFIFYFIQKNSLRYLILSSFIMGLCIVIRAPMVIYLPMFMILFIKNPFRFTELKSLKPILLVIFSLFMGYFSLKMLVNTVSVENMKIEEYRNVIGPLMMGTNIDSNGRHNIPDSELLYSWNKEEVFKNGMVVILDRIIKNPLDLLKNLKYKFGYMF
ncbi:MAG: glycosyltransferase family 39 protein, partial [Anaerolineaceae bacterium]|nr:glycosyltransferase family 39 protein [Anaerolineaceae bacterium]